MMKMRSGHGLLAAFCALALACGGGSGKATTNDQNVSATPAKLSVGVSAKQVKAGQGAVTAVAYLENSTDAVTWSLVGKGSLSQQGLTATYQPPASLAASDSAKIVATAGALTASASITVLGNEGPGATTITVTGTVFDEDYNARSLVPVAVMDATGKLFGPTNTLNNGTFSFAGVTAPYDVVVSAPHKTVYIYKGLTVEAPRIFLWEKRDSGPGIAEFKADIDISSSALFKDRTNWAVAYNSPGVHSWYDPDALKFTYSTFPKASSDLNVEWNGPSHQVGTLFALGWFPDTFFPYNPQPTSYMYGFKNGVAIDPNETEKVALDLYSVASDNVSGQFTLPPSYSLEAKFFGLTFGAWNGSSDLAVDPYAFGVFLESILDDPQLGPNFAYQYPDLPTAFAQVCGAAESERRRGETKSVTCKTALSSDSNNVVIPIYQAPEPAGPFDDAEGVTYATNFRWTPYTDAPGLYVVTMKPNRENCLRLASTTGIGCNSDPIEDDDDKSPKFVIITAAESVTIPDLRTDLGFGLLADTDYNWKVRFMGPFGCMDDFVTRQWVSVPPFNTIMPPNTLKGENVAYWSKSVWSMFSTADDLSTTP